MSALPAAWPAAVAVSGGGDSLALMLLLARWAKAQRLPQPAVLTVDHGLRKNSAAGAERVVRWAKAAGLKAHVLRWQGKKPKSDVEAAAREARYALVGAWCAARAVRTVYAAHNLEDQAETFLLRLARGSGVDGLAAMQPVARFPSPQFGQLSLVRPLLGFSREELREFLHAAGQPWLEDPMNGDPRFARVRIRRLWSELEQAGLSPRRIAAAAAHLGRARLALDALSQAMLARYARFDGDGALFNAAAFAAAPRELGLRALSQLLMRVSGAGYRPRFDRLEGLFDAIAAGTIGGGRTLSGCRIGPAPGRLAVFGTATLAVRPEKPRRGA